MSILDYDFMRYAFAAGAVVGLLAPAVGFFLVQRRMSLIGDGIGHVAFAGVAAGYLLGISPVGTALVTAVLGAVAIEWLRSQHRTAGDQALALLFYTGIAAGVVMISAAGALDANLFSFLFGSILTVSQSDLVLVVVLGAAGLALIGLLYRALLAVSLDEDGARVAGVPVGLLNVALAALAAVTISVSMRIVGILLIAALMVLPVIAASRIAWSVRSAILLAMAIGVGSVFAGLTISYYADLAPGGAIVLVAAGCFALAQAAQTLSHRARGGRSPGNGHA
jgi:zinc transport system permease protein